MLAKAMRPLYGSALGAAEAPAAVTAAAMRAVTGGRLGGIYYRKEQDLVRISRRVRPVHPLASRPSATGRLPAMASKREAEELLMIEEADAWFEYLEAIRNQTETRYREIEPWAWARLNQRLRAIRTRRAKLRPAAA
jgi:hypothetical protein